MTNFYNDISEKRDMNQVIHLQTHQEFQQNEIKKLNSEYNVQMFSTRIRGGKAFATANKIRDFKKKLFKRKTIQQSSLSKRINVKKTYSKSNR